MLLLRQGVDISAHSDLLRSAFGKEMAAKLIETDADLPQTRDEVIEKLRSFIDDADMKEDLKSICLLIILRLISHKKEFIIV